MSTMIDGDARWRNANRRRWHKELAQQEKIINMWGNKQDATDKQKHAVLVASGKRVILLAHIKYS